MDAHVIPFPTRGGRPQAPALAVGSGIMPEPASFQEGTSLVMVALELRRLVHAGMPLSYGAEAALRRRCASAGLSVLAEEGSDMRLAGSGEWLVMEATFEGPGATVSAAAAVVGSDDAVRRTGGSEFVVSGAAASGRVVRSGHMTTMVGAPGALLDELLPKAAPGQVLLGGEGWARERRVEVLPAEEVELASGSLPVFVLRGIR